MFSATQRFSRLSPAWRIATIVLIGIVAYYGTRVAKQARQGAVGDFGVYYRAGAACAARAPLYTLDQGPLLTFKNPPVVALAIAPLSALPPAVARMLWFVVDVGCIALLAIALARWLPEEGGLRGWVVLGALALAARYVFNQWHAGSTASGWIALTVWACVALGERRPRFAAALLASAVAWKLVPLCFAPLLLLDRRRATACAWFAGSLCALALIPACWLGWEQNLQQFAAWPGHLFGTETAEQLWRIQNQSVLALCVRLLCETPYGVNVAAWPLATARGVWLIVALLTATALYAWIVAVRRGRHERETTGAVVGMLLVYMTLFNPLAWRYNFVALVVPYGVVLHAILAGHPRRRYLMVLLGVAVGLSLLPAESTGLPGMLLLRTIGARLWGTLLLAAATMLAVPRRARNDPATVWGPWRLSAQSETGPCYGCAEAGRPNASSGNATSTPPSGTSRPTDHITA
ncbi:MAG: DUF2029 domain-containing protein [Pirellulales bacterium]|nr:DUF2029 domain-containing protein [Pirellulales bacterium]